LQHHINSNICKPSLNSSTRTALVTSGWNHWETRKWNSKLNCTCRLHHKNQEYCGYAPFTEDFNCWVHHECFKNCYRSVVWHCLKNKSNVTAVLLLVILSNWGEKRARPKGCKTWMCTLYSNLSVFQTINIPIYVCSSMTFENEFECGTHARFYNLQINTCINSLHGIDR
jgi:hypothetical protein